MIRILGAAIASVLISVSPVSAQTSVSHGIAMHGDLKYPADFKHFDYVNPDAPKGGNVNLTASGTFDTLNPLRQRRKHGDEVNFLERLAVPGLLRDIPDQQNHRC